jgi:predicted transcriptional regulator
MVEAFEDVIEKLRKLPVDQQFTVPNAHRAAIFDGLEQAERGQFVSDDEMTALWKKCGL